jgi:hypothetical protein
MCVTCLRIIPAGYLPIAMQTLMFGAAPDHRHNADCHNSRLSPSRIKAGMSRPRAGHGHVRLPPESNGKQSRFLPSGQLEYSDVFLNNRLGVVLSVSESNTYIQRERMTADWDYSPTAINPAPISMVAMRAQQINQSQERFVSSLTLDFKATDKLILSMVGMFNQSETWSGQRSWLFTTGNRLASITGDQLTDFTTNCRDTRINTESLAIEKKGRGVTLIPSFDYDDGDLKLDGNVAYSAIAATSFASAPASGTAARRMGRTRRSWGRSRKPGWRRGWTIRRAGI